MDRGKKQGKFIANRNCKIYMDLKDIIRENALPYLPAKSLRRCTAVCRDWKLQISTPFFAHSQTNCFSDVSGFFCQSRSGIPKFIPIDPMAYGVPDPSFSFLPEPVVVRCASNGLVCCQGSTGYNAYYICNPVNKQWKKLPKPSADHGSDPAIVIAFEPSLLNFVAEYKLVCAFPSDLDGVEFEIYSSAEGTWRISGEICYGRRMPVSKSGVVTGGIAYWQLAGSQVLAFDLTSERTTLQYGPHGPLGAVNGKLYSGSLGSLTLSVSELSNAFTNTMGMHSNTQAWKVKQRINIDASLFEKDQFTRATVVLIAGNIVLIQGWKTLLSYDMRTRVFTALAADTDSSTRMVPYVNSLVEI